MLNKHFLTNMITCHDATSESFNLDESMLTVPQNQSLQVHSTKGNSVYPKGNQIEPKLNTTKNKLDYFNYLFKGASKTISKYHGDNSKNL